MEYSSESCRAALLLTNRVVPVDAKPLTAREFWRLVERIDPEELLHGDVDATAIAEQLGADVDEGIRLRTLLDAAAALGFEEERLHDGGISLVSAIDPKFPSGLRQRLGQACPPFLLVAGPIEWLSRLGLGVVGSRNAGEDALTAARQAAELAVGEGWPVVSGLARGVDQVAMAAALDTGGEVIGIPAEGILKASRNSEVRSRVHGGELCIASPYGPNAPFRAGNAMGRNKIVYAMSHVAFVVAAEEGSGGTWSGATEALDRGYSPVAVWSGPGATTGNHALVARGATPVNDLRQLFEIDANQTPSPRQRSLF